MTQPALSRQISALEHDLGSRLFDRDRRGTALPTQANSSSRTLARCWLPRRPWSGVLGSPGEAQPGSRSGSCPVSTPPR
jgi:hypothetical protein